MFASKPLVKNQKYIPFRFGIILCFLLFLSRPDNTTAQEPSKIRQLAYGKSGEWLYEGLAKEIHPKTRTLTPKERPFTIPINWAKQSADHKDFSFLSDLGGLDYRTPRGKATAYLAGFMPKYYEDGPKLFDAYFEQVTRTRYLTEKQKGEITDNQLLQRERSMVFYLAYDQSKVQLIYYPGKIQYKGGARDSMKGWNQLTPEEIKNGTRTDYALIQDSRGLLGILNGTFDKIDNFVKWGPKGGVGFGGFGYDFTVLSEPQSEMATFALYENGRTVLGTYRLLPRKNKIRSFVQNRFMVLENGKLAKDSDPNAFCSFYDNIARSYLFTDKKGRIGYLWTLYTPANVIAPIALRMGIQNMMLLDIHAPLSCSITHPETPLHYQSFHDYMAHSYDLVPNFFRLSPLKSSLTWISTALNSRIQTHYSIEAFKLGTEDYFAVFLKNSPEARVVQKPRNSSKLAGSSKP